MKKEDKLPSELFENALSLQEIGNAAVHHALEENKRKNIPSVFSHDGVIYFKMPNGEITRQNPFG